MLTKLTPSMAEDLQNCAYAFDQKYLKAVREPFTSSPQAQLGTNVHNALDTFYKRGAHARQGLNDLINVLNARWSGEGFITIEEELGYKEHARLLIKDYYELSKDEPACQKRQTEKFYSTDKPRKLGQHRLNLSAKFDRIDLFADGTVEIIDYKTGTPANGLPDEQEMAESLANLIYYRLAAELYPSAPSISISRFFLKAKRKVSICYTPQRVAVAKNLLESLLDKVEEGVVPPTENFSCAWCVVKKVGKCALFSHGVTNEDNEEEEF